MTSSPGQHVRTEAGHDSRIVNFEVNSANRLAVRFLYCEAVAGALSRRSGIHFSTYDELLLALNAAVRLRGEEIVKTSL